MDFKKLEQDAGIVFMGCEPKWQAKDARLKYTESGLACDAQPGLVTTSNSGIPSYLSNYFSPEIIDILVSPMKAAEVAGSEKKVGDWTMTTATFTTVESTGETSAYGDYANNGVSGVNTTFPQRQSFHYQVMTQYGELELERAGLARIDLVNRLNAASVLTLNKYQNKTYFYGVAGLQNYGLLNSPNLSASIIPTTKAAGGTSWALATALEVLADLKKLFVKLQTQSNGLVEQDTVMTLSLSPTSYSNGFLTTSEFNVTVAERVKALYPNLKIVQAVEYSTPAGELMQLKADNVMGQETCSVAFTEKLRAHPIITDVSSWRQKKSQGTWGAIIYRPFLIASMLGI